MVIAGELADLRGVTARYDGRAASGEGSKRSIIVPGALGIAEPKGKRSTSSILAGVDLIFAHAMALDTEGYRLGK